MRRNERKEGLLNKIMKGIIKFSRRKLVRNKIFSLICLIIGYLSIGVFDGIGICILYILAAIMFFFMRVDFIDWFMNEDV